MSKASEQELATLHGAIAVGLTEVITQGAVVGLDADGAPIKATASAAYFMAGITLLKNNNITADAGKNAELSALSEALNKRRRTSKTTLSQRSIDQAVDELERDLGGMMQ